MKFQSHRSISRFSYLLLFLFTLSSPVFSEENKNIPEFKTRTKQIMAFKNGLGFFIREGKVNLNENWAMTDSVPQATLGSLWFGSLDKNTFVEEVISFKDKSSRITDALTMDELLKANIGNPVWLVYSGQTISGIIKSVPDNTDIANVPSPYRSYYTPLNTGSLVLIQTENEILAVNKGLINAIAFNGKFNSTYTRESTSNRFKIKINSTQKNPSITLSYLQKGLSWMPSYYINVENPEKAKITMQSSLMNDIEDLEDIEVYFVVGYPNFAYSDILSPMSVDQTLVQFISALSSGRSNVAAGDQFSNIMRQSAGDYGEGFRSESSYPEGFGYSTKPGLQGSSEEDLFLYQKKGVHLKKGERANYPVFSDIVEYKHIYEWTIPDTLGQQSSDKKDKEQVWHSIKLTNSTDYPWTTAPAFTVNGNKPIAQDILEYTAKGAKTNLKLTIATDIKAEKREFEIDRQKDITVDYRHYDLVTISGELYIRNFKSKDAEIEITKAVTGDILETSHEGKVTTIAEGLKSVNKNNRIKWVITSKPGEEATVTYKYKVHIAR